MKLILRVFVFLLIYNRVFSQTLVPETINFSNINSLPMSESETYRATETELNLFSSCKSNILFHNYLEDNLKTTTLHKIDNLKTITTRQIPKANELYKRCVRGVVILYSIDATHMGSGSIISDKGEIITNWHVADGSEQMAVFFHDPKYSVPQDLDSYELAEVVAVDKARDLALLKLKNKPKTGFLKLGESYNCEVAQDVFAIGHPDGLLWSFSYGVISRLRNKYQWQYSTIDSMCANVIQTQTPSNPGCSGGPLFNDKGELIGINSFSIKGQGLNFAVRIDEITDFVNGAREGNYSFADIQPADEDKEIVWEPVDSDNNGVIDLYRADVDADGDYDILKVDSNEDEIIDCILLDTNDDLAIDVIIYDKDGNGTFEYFVFDDDYDGVYDTAGVDTDGDMVPDAMFAYTGE